MTRILRVVLVCVVLLGVTSIAQCADVYPTVNFAFNATTFEYSWTVNYTANVNVNLSRFMVYASVPDSCWTSVSGAWSGSPAQNEGWTFTDPDNGDGTFALRWYADSGQQRTPSGGVWTGVFKITIPNSQPVAGSVGTYVNATKSLTQSSFVPQMVPEPSSVMSLGSFAGLAALLMRRKKL